MARRTKLWDATVDRDKGKLFLITEMPAMQAEKWAIRALLMLTKAGVEIPDNVMARGMEAIAASGYQALTALKFDDVEPLLDEMLGCVQIVRDRAHPEFGQPLIMDTDIEEVQTLFSLRKEVFSLHTGFLQAAAKSTSQGSAAASTSPSSGASHGQRTSRRR